MTPVEVLVSSNVEETLRALPNAEQDEVLHFLETVLVDPNQYAQLEQMDLDGESYRAARVGSDLWVISRLLSDQEVQLLDTGQEAIVVIAVDRLDAGVSNG